MTDHVFIRDLKVEAKVGLTDEERSAPQQLTVNIEIATDLRGAGTSDDIDQTIDYGEVAIAAADLVRSTEVKLLETLAERIAAQITAMEGVDVVTVEIAKDEPPIPESLRDVGVRIERTPG